MSYQSFLRVTPKSQVPPTLTSNQTIDTDSEPDKSGFTVTVNGTD